MSGDLCEELIFEIFTRLPSKSLLRFRSVSKSLCSLIASPDFIRMHTSRSPQKVLITHRFCCKEEEHKSEVFYTVHSENQLPLCPRHGYIGITALQFPYSKYSWCVGSCNGILCQLEYKSGINSFSLWNPFIRRKLTLPDCPQRSVFFPDPTGIGFGFDPITNDYKIVSLPRYGGFGESSLVYTMKTGTWCAVTSITPRFDDVTSRGCFANGALHWVVERDFTESDKVKRFYILTFNLNTHVFGVIALPEPTCETILLTTIQGYLAVISLRNDDSWIWVMREYHNTASWSMVFKAKANQPKGKLLRVLIPTSNGDMLFDTYYEGFQVYDAKIATRLILQDLDDDSYILDMVPCLESLLLLDIGTPCQVSQLSIREGSSLMDVLDH